MIFDGVGKTRDHASPRTQQREGKRFMNSVRKFLDHNHSPTQAKEAGVGHPAFERQWKPILPGGGLPTFLAQPAVKSLTPFRAGSRINPLQETSYEKRETCYFRALRLFVAGRAAGLGPRRKPNGWQEGE